MKMVKSLLLGSAAALVAATAGQAADLPVKAKPVEYVKVCSLYGAGFYYMPGTDMCIKIGGWVRVEATDGNTNGSMTWGPYSGQQNNRNTSNFVTRERGYITADAREQTAYGTARAYIDVGISNSDTQSSVGAFSSNRAFLQWAGITAGLTQSFYDFYSAAAAAYRAAFLPIEDTGDGGQWVWAYTAQLGNGLSATVSAEERRNTQVIGQIGATGVAATSFGNGGIVPGADSFGTGYGGNQVPDIVGNLRLDQTWGSVQIMGAYHDVNPNYYLANSSIVGAGNGHPGDTAGWVVGAGLRLNFPMIAQGDYFQSEVNYTRGALRYLNDPEGGNFGESTGNNEVFGVMSDCVYGGTTVAAGNQTGCNLTSAWSINASYEHYWTPSVHQSIVGAYEAVSYGSQANAILCAGAGNGTGIGSFAVAASGCDNNWNVWGLSSRLQWDITKSFYIGVEGLYANMNGGSTSDGLTHGYGLGAPNSPQLVSSNQSTWAGTIRMHKDFLP
ncbi:MAG: porin [Xanthobacteraceae bacterium]